MSDFLFFLLTALVVFGEYLDVRTTAVSLVHGAKEGNPISGWLMKVLGMPGFYILKVVGFGLGGSAIANFYIGGKLGLTTMLILAAEGFGPGLYNYFSLRKRGLKTF